MLSPEVQSRLDTARFAEATYQPREDIASRLGEKVLIMLVGPAAAGKTYIMDEVVASDPRFQRVSVFTTRTARPDDAPGMFRCLPHDDEHVSQLLGLIDEREVVQYAVHPTQGTIYGTMVDDYPGEANLLATLSGSVEHMRRLPFKEAYAVCLATMPDDWQSWFDDRFPVGHPDRIKRLGEAVSSLEWMLDEANQGIIRWVPNFAGQPEVAAREIISVTDGTEPKRDETLVDYAKATLERARQLASHEV